MKKIRTVFSLLISLLILVQFTSYANSDSQADAADFKILGSVGGPTNAVAVNGNYVYVGKGTSIIVLENTEGRLLQKGFQLKLPSFITDLEVEGKTLYAAAGDAGLYIVDISDPLKPLKKGIYTSSGYAEALEVKGSIAYLANGKEGLQIIDVKNPAAPVALGQVYKNKYAFDVVISGNYAYIAAADDGLLLADISNGGVPREVASCDTPGIARNVKASGEYVFVADDWKGVAIVKVDKPDMPVLIKNIPTAGRAHGLALNGNHLYVADAYMGLRMFDVTSLSAPRDVSSFVPADTHMLRVVSGNGMVFGVDRVNGVFCFDANTSIFKLKGFYSHTIPIPAIMPTELRYWDNADEISRLCVLGFLNEKAIEPDRSMTRAELSDLLYKVLKLSVKPEKKAVFLDVPTTYKARASIETIAKLGYISPKDRSHFDPEGSLSYAEVASCLLKLVGRAPISGKWPDNCLKEAENIGLQNSTSRMEDSNGVQRANVLAMLSRVICDIPDAKTGQTLLKSKFGIELQAFPMQVIGTAVKDGYAYTISGKSGLSVVDIHDPANPRQVAHLDFSVAVTLIRLNGNYAYLLTNNRLYTVDIKDPKHPILIHTSLYKSGAPARGVDIDSGKMYVADEWGYKVYSLANPSNPEPLKEHKLMIDGRVSCTSDIAVQNGIAYIPMEFDGVKIVDVSNPQSYRILNTYSVKNGDYDPFYTNVQFFGNRAYVKGSGQSRLEILDISDIQNPKRVGLLGNTNSTQFSYQMALYGTYALLPNGINGVLAADISSESGVKTGAVLDTIGVPNSITVDGDRAYISDNIGGMCIVGLTDQMIQPSSVQAGSITSGAASCSFNTSLFQGLPVERYVLNTDKALAVLNNIKTTFPKTLTVANTNDSGPGSLRWCLENIQQGGRIIFDTTAFKPSKPAVIYCRSTLEFNSGGVLLDASNAGVILDGSKAPAEAGGLFINTNGNIIRGLKIQNFKNYAIQVDGDSNIVGGSRLKGSAPNGEGNVFIKSGNVWVNGNDCIIVGNNVGIDSDGVTPAGNTGGLDLRGALRNTVGISRPGYGNLVGDNDGLGISLMGITYGNLIEGNYVGTDITGIKAIGNHISHGISCEMGAYGNIIRNNVTCGNGRGGINIWDGGACYNVILENSIGLGADGKTIIPNGGIFSLGGGVGGGVWYNVIEGNKTGTDHKGYEQHDEVMGEAEGVYDTFFNGEVYKYSNKSRY
ncbi:MAG TPA: hypothetical protein VHT96_09135 [Clostridia bacterium]|nr:hypothetical protein [Clostridia bacterium]